MGTICKNLLIVPGIVSCNFEQFPGFVSFHQLLRDLVKRIEDPRYSYSFITSRESAAQRNATEAAKIFLSSTH